jgi:phospholipase/carboxylesterase
MRHIQQGIDSSGLRFVRNIPSAGSDFLLVALHGYGKCMTHVFDLFLELDAELPVVAVQAPYRLGPGAYQWFGYQPGSSTEILEHEWLASAQRLAHFLDNLSRGGHARGLCLAGHSQGAMMSLDAALARPALVRRCACINGRLLPQSAARLAGSEPAALRASRFLVAHASDDATVPAHNGRAAADWLRGTAACVRFAAYPGGHALDPVVARDVLAWLRDEASTDSIPGKHP